MKIFNIRASTNQTFRWTRDLSALAAIYDLAAATIRMQIRASRNAPDAPAYEWVTGGAGGQILFDPATGFCVIVAPDTDMTDLGGDWVYDCRVEVAGGGSAVIFGGRATIYFGVTRLPSESGGI